MAMKEDGFPSTTADFPSTTKALLSSCVSQEMKFDKRAISYIKSKGKDEHGGIHCTEGTKG